MGNSSFSKEIDDLIIQQAKIRQWPYIKLDSIDGVPNRMLMYGNGKFALIDLERKNVNRLTICQIVAHSVLRRHGFLIYVPATIDEAYDIFYELSDDLTRCHHMLKPGEPMIFHHEKWYQEQLERDRKTFLDELKNNDPIAVAEDQVRKLELPKDLNAFYFFNK